MASKLLFTVDGDTGISLLAQQVTTANLAHKNQVGHAKIDSKSPEYS